jgi:hypothetical protein
MLFLGTFLTLMTHDIGFLVTFEIFSFCTLEFLFFEKFYFLETLENFRICFWLVLGDFYNICFVASAQWDIQRENKLKYARFKTQPGEKS